jgi:hypothetical protein
MKTLVQLSEPLLRFAHGQAMEDPRDGLTLFGPLEQGKPYGLRPGVIGTPEGISKFSRWVDWIQGPIRAVGYERGRPPYPGFESAFRVPWATVPLLTITVDPDELSRRVVIEDAHERVYETVELYAAPLRRARADEEVKPDVWFVVVPDIVRQYCRPKAIVDPSLRRLGRQMFSSTREAKSFLASPSLFAEQNVAAEPYSYKEHFRNQLKARLLGSYIATQVVRESTLENIGPQGSSKADQSMERLQSGIAWNLSTTAFYKCGGRPWKVDGIREGVCYVGIVFKKDNSSDERMACCGAQMFLDSGDGVVFKGAVGPWYNAVEREFHLSREAARDLAQMAIASYEAKHSSAKNSSPLREIFFHGKAAFNGNEMRGFAEATPSATDLVGVKITDDASLKLFRKGDTPLLRGAAYIRGTRSGYLWTRGWIPRMQTYPGMEVPNPLRIEVCSGTTEIRTVLQDILALTKLNYNACVFGDGRPITIKFANAVGEVLTAGPARTDAPLPFMYYI